MTHDGIWPEEIEGASLEIEIAYHERRASEEIQAAQRDKRPKVARCHYELAVRYLEKADALVRVRRSQTRPVCSVDQPAGARLSLVCSVLASNLVGAVCTIDDEGSVICAARDRWGNVQRVAVPADADAVSVHHHARLLRERVQTRVRSSAL